MRGINKRQCFCSPASDLLGRWCVCQASGSDAREGPPHGKRSRIVLQLTSWCLIFWLEFAFPVLPRVATGPRGVYFHLGKGLGTDSLRRHRGCGKTVLGKHIREGNVVNVLIRQTTLSGAGRRCPHPWHAFSSCVHVSRDLSPVSQAATTAAASRDIYLRF